MISSIVTLVVALATIITAVVSVVQALNLRIYPPEVLQDLQITVRGIEYLPLDQNEYQWGRRERINLLIAPLVLIAFWAILLISLVTLKLQTPVPLYIVYPFAILALFVLIIPIWLYRSYLAIANPQRQPLTELYVFSQAHMDVTCKEECLNKKIRSALGFMKATSVDFQDRVFMASFRYRYRGVLIISVSVEPAGEDQFVVTVSYGGNIGDLRWYMRYARQFISLFCGTKASIGYY